MDTGSFRFQFRDPQQAAQACETLKEIGYAASTNGDTGLSVHVENQDVLSALEICQAYEGSIIETGVVTYRPGNQNNGVPNPGYSPEDWIIPAHIINEDWSEAYKSGSSQTFTNTAQEHNVSSDQHPEDEVDGFSGSVHT
ncbi:hypothetical protein [Paenibacillus ottowii]|uniref:Uncharacterized protein n=1 Tax=Paenibacillus ottowii TaxID=2315729 RepID=A0ABY3B1S3_9BACL|nr:hypothetical protein [Paenibacillus ottowii]NEU24790.1 hypothetical protein [Paenibacillus polymyxa]TQR97648.1 hypothetical protein FKV70_17705 [Paenibacillus ottowii]